MSPLVDQYVEGLRARRLKAHAIRALAVEAVHAELGPVSSLLREKYGVTRVVLFGSFARGEARQDSDVDLLIEGLATQDYFDVAAEISRLLRRDVDLVRVEDASPLLLERVAQHGVVIGE